MFDLLMQTVNYLLMQMYVQRRGELQSQDRDAAAKTSFKFFFIFLIFIFAKLRRPIIFPTAVDCVSLLTQFHGGNLPYALEHLVNYSKCQVSLVFVHANVLFSAV